MAEQKRAARAAWKGSGAKAVGRAVVRHRRGDRQHRIHRLHRRRGRGAGRRAGQGRRAGRAQAGAGDTVAILVNQTPFYGESGGQMGDAGTIAQRQGLARRPSPTRPSRSAASARIMRRSRRGDDRGRRHACSLPIDAERRDRDPRQPFRDAPAARGAAPAARRACHAEGHRWSRPTGCASISRIRPR